MEEIPISTARAGDKRSRRWSRRAPRLLLASLSYWVYPVAFSVGVLLAWQAATVMLDIQEYELPAPTSVLDAMISDWSTLQANIMPTLKEVLYGFGIALVFGVALAVVIVSVPLIGRCLYPLLIASQVVPKVAIAPVFLIWFGFGTTPKIVIAAMMAFFPIVVDTALGLNSVSKDLVALVRSMGSSRWKAFWKVRFMHALPNIFVGMKIGITLAVVGAVVGEFVGSDEGLGYLILTANSELKTSLVFAAIFVLTGIGVGLYVVIEGIERVALRNRR